MKTAMSREHEAKQLGGLPRSTIHDLRTPLTSIRGYAQLLMRGVRSEAQAQRAYQTIFRESERLALMFDQLSRVAEVTLGSGPREPIRCDLAQLVQTQLEQSTERWPEHNFVVRRLEPAPVCVDPQRVGELIGSLIDNAAAFSSPGSTVELSTAVSGNETSLTLRDQGIGIPADELDLIFECFHRGSNASQAGPHATRGLGIGLFLARAEAVQAGGRLWAESVLEVGSTFHLMLPLAAQESPPMPPVDGHSTPSYSRPTAS
jgi:signal transduction histidine kinase